MQRMPQNPFRSENILRANDAGLFDACYRLAERVSKEPATMSVPPRVLAVGGFVRDAHLGIASSDVDVEVYGVSPERLEALLEDLFDGRVNTVGRTFGILKVALGDGKDLDVALPRRESKVGKGHKGFSVAGDPTLSPEEAARRRDFTINAIAADPLTGEVIDPFNGVADLEQNVLRVVDPATFVDDPLRVYRAAQFAARFGLTVEPKTIGLMRQMVTDEALLELSSERVTDEFKKLFLKAPRPSVGFELLREIGVIERHWPEIHALVGTPQELEWHPEGDVWIHTMMVVDEAAKIIRQDARNFDATKKLHVVLGALCHDFGKPVTTGVVEGRIRSRGHEAAGETPTRAFLGRLAFGEDALKASVVSATEHLKPPLLFRELEAGKVTGAQYENAVRKLVTRIHPVPWQVLIAIAEADFRGRGTANAKNPIYTIGNRFIEAVEHLGLDRESPKPLLRGEDLIALGVEPGPKMGHLIREIEDARDRGDIQTKDEALRLVQSLL